MNSRIFKRDFSVFPIVLWKWDDLSTLSIHVWVVKCFQLFFELTFSLCMNESELQDLLFSYQFLSLCPFTRFELLLVNGSRVFPGTPGFFEVQGWLIMMALGSSFSPITEAGSSYLSLSHHRAIHYRFDKTRLKTRWDKFDGYSNKRNRKWPIRDLDL